MKKLLNLFFLSCFAFSASTFCNSCDRDALFLKQTEVESGTLAVDLENLEINSDGIFMHHNGL